MKVIRLATILFLLVSTFVGFASAQEIASPYIPGAVPRFTVIRHPGLNVDDALSASSAGAMIPLWNGSFTSSSTVYPFVMVGTDPSQGSVSTTVPTVVVPLIFRFHDGRSIHSLSATAKVCHGSHSALSLTRKSPIFQSFSYPSTSTALGTTQYLDAFQRANFWTDVSTTSPDYHVLLRKTGQTAAVVVNVPAADGFSSRGPCARVGEVEIGWFDGTIIPKLLTKMAALKPTAFPIFLSYNVLLYQGVSADCCILGYHSEITNTKGNQTYAYASFDDPGIFVGTPPPPLEDIDALSHEVAEWMNDPLVSTDVNITPPWGHIGQVTGCQDNLEVGDPLTGNAFTITNPTNHFSYHPQDLAFVPWFAQGPSSSSVNGWFDFTNLLGSSAAPCS